MKTALLVAAAALTVANAARAADLPSKGPFKAAPAIVASPWTGPYVGLGLGVRATQTEAATTSLIEGTPPGNIGLFAPIQSLDGAGLRGSFYFGFNWQFAPHWVTGIEGDVGSASRTTSLPGYNFSPGLGPSGDGADSFSVKATWDATLRARFGYLLTPATLLYATGGAAWQRYEVTSTCAAAGFTPQTITDSTTRLGWTIGGGLETALWGHWLARAEYRYADYGTMAFTNVRSSPFPAFGPLVDNFNVSMRTHTATFGLAYKFGDAIAGGEPRGAFDAFAADMATVSWTGPYVGLGLGARASRADLTTTSETTGGTPVDLTNTANGTPFDGTAFHANPYVGFNWQFASRWVAGIEGDVGLARQTTTRDGVSFTPSFNTTGSSGSGDNLAIKTTWDASVRGRLGILLTPATLAYATGGVAWQHYEVTSTCGSSFPCSPANFGFSPAVIASGITKRGWTIGGGFEAALWDHWLVRGEYRYADFGNESITLARSSTTPAFDPTVDTFDVKLRTHTVTFGLAYKFDWGLPASVIR